MKSQPIKVVIVDDQSIVRKGIKAFLGEYEDISVIGEAANGLEAVERTEQLKPDVVLLDLLMPGMDGIETINRICAVQPNQRIIVLTAYFKDDEILQALEEGASAYVRKDAPPEELIQCIKKVCAGEQVLDPALVWKSVRQMSSEQSVAKSPQAL
jgi:two-component system, NarL family, response regulator LiaR